MRIFFKAIFIILALTVAVWFLMPEPQQAALPQSLFFIVSADGPARPGQTQEIVVNAFSRQNNLLVRESGLQLSAALKHATPSNPDSILNFSDLQQSHDGGYRCNFVIPDTSTGSAAFLIFYRGQTGTPAFSCPLNIESDAGLAVLPPPTTIHPGNWLSFKIASINRKTGTGNFRLPVRVKMRTPSGHQTINRVLLTDIHGTAVFTTHIHDHAASGDYEFEFVQGKSRQTLKIPVTPAPDKNQLVRQLFKHRLNLVQPLSPGLMSELAMASAPVYLIRPARSSHSWKPDILSSIRAEIDQAFLTYDCGASEYRQIEVWQNGRIIYNSDLQLEAGRISIPFPHALEPSQPLLFRVWQISSGTMKIQEQATMPANFKLSPVLALLQEAELWATGATGMNFASLFFSRPGVFATSANIVPQVLTGNESPQLVSGGPKMYPHMASDTERLLENTDFTGRSQKRFFVVDNELNLGRYRFSTMKIWLEPGRFFTSIISALRNDQANVDFLIGEAECRAIRFGFISIEDQPAELEKLEGILAILAELDSYAVSHPERAANWSSALNRALGRLCRLIHTPENYAGRTADKSGEDNKVGPFSPILPGEIDLEKLFTALKPGGKVSLITGERSIPMALTGNATIYGDKGLPGQSNRIEKLVNLRSIPVIVELDFSDTDGQ